MDAKANSEMMSIPLEKITTMPPSQPSYPPPIMAQPNINSNGWMNVPLGIAKYPSGLEYLASVDQLLVKQKVEVLEMLTGFETNNKFVIQNSLGQNVYFVAEDNDCCTRNCCGSMRPFDMKIFDNNKREVLHFYRPLSCTGCCFPCCLQSLVVSTRGGHAIGSIEEEWTFCYPHFSVKNRNGDTVLRIEGPIIKLSCGNDVDFKILALDGTQIGKISKQWSGLAREMFSDADHFGVSFPIDLDVGMKAVLLGACILIDMMFYEDSDNKC